MTSMPCSSGARAEGVRGVVTIGTIASQPCRRGAGGRRPRSGRRWGSILMTRPKRRRGLREWRGSRAPRPRSSGWARWGSTSSAISRRGTSRKRLPSPVALARTVAKPVVIHCREAHAGDLAHSSRREGGETAGSCHCFSGDVEIAGASRPGAPDLAGRSRHLQERARAPPTLRGSCPRTISCRDRLSLTCRPPRPTRQAQRAGLCRRSPRPDRRAARSGRGGARRPTTGMPRGSSASS